MLSSVRNIFRVPDLRNKILFTLFMLALYRMGAYVPVPGIDLDAVEELQAPGRERRWRAGLPPAVLRRRAHPVRHLRPRDHAVHHGVDHHADPHGGDPEARGVAAAGRGGAAQDHPVDPLPHDRHRARCSRPVWPSCSTTAAAGCSAAVATPPASTVAARLHAVRGAHRGAHAHRRHRAAHVDGRAHHPARHRQRHVAADLRLGRVSRSPAPGARLNAEKGTPFAHRPARPGRSCCWSPSCSSSRASDASRCSSPSGWWAGACTAARAPTSRSRSTRAA